MLDLFDDTLDYAIWAKDAGQVVHETNGRLAAHGWAYDRWGRDYGGHCLVQPKVTSESGQRNR